MLFSAQRLRDCPDFLRDESRKIGTADFVATPATCHEVADALREARERNLRVTIQGARTGVAGGAVPFGGVVLSLTRMNRILGVRWENDTCFIRAQPGVRLAELRHYVAGGVISHTDWDSESLHAEQRLRNATRANGFFFPPDPTETTASLGGMCATNASGACSYLYGPTRNYINALRVILASGETLQLQRGKPFPLPHTSGWGGPAHNIKNAAGFFYRDNMDALDLFIGSGGQLGVITELELRLLPRPPVEWGLMCFFKAENEIPAVVANARALPRIAAIEFFDTGILSMLRQDVGRGGAFWPRLETEWNCAVYFEIHADNEAAAAETLRNIANLTHGLLCGSWMATEAVDRERLKKFRHAAPEGVNLRIAQRKQTHPNLTKLGTDFSVPAERLRDVLRLYRDGLSSANLEGVIFGHIGDTHLHVNVLPRDMADYERALQLYKNWAQQICDWHGSVSAEHGTGRLKVAFLRMMYGEEGFAKMEALRHTFDPEDRFAW